MLQLPSVGYGDGTARVLGLPRGVVPYHEGVVGMKHESESMRYPSVEHLNLEIMALGHVDRATEPKHVRAITQHTLYWV